MSHTQGRLRIGTPPPNGEQTIGTEQGLMVAVATTGIDIPTKANARRLVAAWNACEGITTERLEDLGRPLMAHLIGCDERAARQVKEADALRAVNAKLVEALEACTTEEGPTQAELNNARAALAKAKELKGTE